MLWCFATVASSGIILQVNPPKNEILWRFSFEALLCVESQAVGQGTDKFQSISGLWERQLFFVFWCCFFYHWKVAKIKPPEWIKLSDFCHSSPRPQAEKWKSSSPQVSSSATLVQTLTCSNLRSHGRKGDGTYGDFKSWKETITYWGLCHLFNDTLRLYGLPKIFSYNPRINEERLDFPNPTYPPGVPG